MRNEAPLVPEARRLKLAISLDGDVGWMGGIIYVRNMIYCLASLPEDERPQVQVVGALNADEHLLHEMTQLSFVNAFTPYVWARKSRYARWGLSKADKILRRFLGAGASPELFGVDVVYPSMRVNGDAQCRLFWIPDFQHLRLPEMFSADERQKRSEAYQRISESNGTLVLSSQDALADFKKFFPEAVVKTEVWNFCTVLTNNELGGKNPHKAYGLPEKYLYLPNQFWAHKDHMTALEALAKLKRRGMAVSLVCTGAEHDYRNRDHMAKLKLFIAEQGLEDQVHFLGLVARNDQVEIFRHAAGVLQPSLFEGWSTVVEDTRAIGRPIVLSNIGVHVEQDPPNSRYFKAGDVEDLVDVLTEWWPELKPGPDKKSEMEALKNGKLNQRLVARRFLEITEQHIRYSKL